MNLAPRNLGLFTPTRDRALVLTWALSGTVLALVLHVLVRRPWLIDGRTYFSVWQGSSLYDLPPNTHGAYLYSPLFAQLLTPFTLLPWWCFSTLWFFAAVSTYAWLIRPVGWQWGVPLLALAVEDATIGNISWLLALACVLGMRRPIAWAVPLLTKLTPGVGALWFAGRRDWRACLRIIAGTLLAVSVSYAIAPQLWQQWVAFLTAHREHDSSLPVRVFLGAALAYLGGRTNRAWLIPVSLCIATPLSMVYTLGMLAAIPRLLSPHALTRARRPFGSFSVFARRVLDLPPVRVTQT